MVVAFAAVGVGGTRPATAAPVCPAAVRSAAEASLVAKSCRGAEEVTAGGSEYRRVLANTDGSFTEEESVVPTRVQQPDGSWVAADPTLVASGDGWVPRASSVDVTLSNGGSGPFVTYRSGGATLNLTWPLGSLPVPVVSGSLVRYGSVLPGVDLWVSVSTSGFRPVLQVADAAAAANPALRAVSYAVGGTVHGVSLTDGRVRFADAAGHTVAMTDSAVMWDSTVDNSVPAPGPSALSSAEHPGDFARMGQVAVASAGADLTLVPDASMLTSASTRWPLFIDPSISPSQNRFYYADSANVNNTTDYARVGLDPDTGDLYRSYFNMPTSQSGLTWLGKRILSAEFDIELYHSYACSDSQDDWTWAYQTTGLSSTSTRIPWSGSGSRPLPANAGVSAQGHANKAGGCGSIQPDVLMRFSGGALTSRVQVAADGKWSMFTFGLCACNPSSQYENGQFRWKKFYIDSRAKLIVTYDTVPGTPANLTSSGGACGSTIGTVSPTLSAQAVDADGGDTLSAVFQYQQVPSGALVSVSRTGIPANNFTTAALSFGAAADGNNYQWRVQTTDAAGFASPWSGWCTFTIDVAQPADPVVTATGSPLYEPCDPAKIPTGGCVSAGGPGVPGSFTLSPNGTTNVTSFSYGWSNPPTTTVTVAAGASASVTVTPPGFGLNTLYVLSSNGVKKSDVVPYRFLVGAPSAALADWPLDDINSHNFTDQVSHAALTVNSGVSWTQDARYIGAKAATFSGVSGTGYATGSVPALDTSQSFSVAAWVRASTIADGNRTAVSQNAGGTGDDSAFYLGTRYTGSPATPHWAFMVQNTASSAGGGVAIFSTAQLDTTTVGKWVYLVGVFDAGQKTMSLYVDGKLAATNARTVTPWRATGPVAIGNAQWLGGPTDGWPGQVADVRLWNRAITVDDLWGTDEDPGNGVPSVRGLMYPTEVGSWTFADVAGCECGGPSRSGATFTHDMYLDPGWANASPASVFTPDSLDGDGSLWTDGVSGYASTTNPNDGVARPVLRTDQSFTVSAWVNMQSLPNRNATAVSQDGSVVTPFALQYQWTAAQSPGWAFTIVGGDAASGEPVYGARVNGATTGWTHLVGVYDAFAGTVSLYINGTLAATRGGATTSFQANGSLRLNELRWNSGFGDQLPGWTDGVEVWQGVLSDRDIAEL